MLTPISMVRSMFDDFFDSTSAAWSGAMMRTDIKETDQGYELMVDLPGIKRENLSLELKNGYLCISAPTGAAPEPASGETYLRRERFSGAFRRAFYVGDQIQESDIRAKLEDSTLHLFIPKKNQNAKLDNSHTIAIEG